MGGSRGSCVKKIALTRAGRDSGAGTGGEGTDFWRAFSLNHAFKGHSDTDESEPRSLAFLLQLIHEPQAVVELMN